jgi:hypothetical protein
MCRYVRLTVFVLFLVLPFCLRAAKPKNCISAELAAHRLNKDLCVNAHVYEIVVLPDGTRFLDICPPATPDEQCHFTIIALPEDRETVGELERYRDADVKIRGLVRPVQGRAWMQLNHVRQFYGGPPLFHPNLLLSRGFSAQQQHAPLPDPNLRPQGSQRAFMNNKDQIELIRKSR